MHDEAAWTLLVLSAEWPLTFESCLMNLPYFQDVCSRVFRMFALSKKERLTPTKEVGNALHPPFISRSHAEMPDRSAEQGTS